MKILYAVPRYPQSCNSYIEAEMNFAHEKGVEVHVWSPEEGYGEYLPPPIHRGPLDTVVKMIRPDLVHVHHLTMAFEILQRIPPVVPITVRAHSLDWSLSIVEAVASYRHVQAIYAFPHFARETKLEKVVPMPVAYDATLYDRKLDDIFGAVHRNHVVRLASSRRTKGLNDFFETAKLVKDAKFTLAVFPIPGEEAYLEELFHRGERTGVNVMSALNREWAVAMIRTAGIYMSTSDPNRSFGMPISIAEALAAGCYVLARDCPEVHEYIGSCGAVYGSVEEAAGHIRRAIKWEPDTWESVSMTARGRAQDFRNDVVLERLVEDWKKFTS